VLVSERPSRTSRGAATILIAEDHPDSREALRALLEAAGYSVLVATNGREAIECARSRPPDLILMDIMMPEVDGFQATRTIRQEGGRLASVPIVAVTAMEGSRNLTQAAGCDDFVSKPIDVRPFLEKIRDWLDRKETDAA
jgi:CheY-like chemotaxis protein